MEFRVLGPLEVRHAGEILQVRAPRQRSLLAALLLHANQVVTADRLIDVMWGQYPPPSAGANLRTHVAGLRRNLSRAKGGGGRVVARSGGYLIVVRAGELDLSAFEELAGQGKAATQRSEHALAAQWLGEALALWHGRPLENVVLAGTAEADAVRLTEDRINVLEDCLQARIAAGEHASVVGDLRGLVLEHPLREHLWALLMLALYRCGRKAEALTAFDEARAQLADQIGLDPGTELCRLHQRILVGDPVLSGQRSEPGQLLALATGPWPTSRAPRVVAAPSQLPPAIADFTGRAALLRRLDMLIAEREDAPTAQMITSIAGTAGVGKTALVLHWAHRVRGHFPDGQLYVNLLGYDQGPPLHPEHVLGQFLRALGVPAELVPAGVAEASGMYRSLLADKRMLVILDNAASPDQVRPILPASAGCLVVVTSRDRLDGLVAKDAARRITLEVLPLDEALALLGRMTGENRVRAEPAAAADLATTCACLPLALRIAAVQLASQPDRAIADYVKQLRQGNPLVALEIDGGGISAGRERTAAASLLSDHYLRLSNAAAELLYSHLLRLPQPPEQFGTPLAGFERHAGALAWLDADRPDRASEALALVNLGIMQENLGRLDAARVLYGKALVICREIGTRNGEVPNDPERLPPADAQWAS